MDKEKLYEEFSKFVEAMKIEKALLIIPLDDEYNMSLAVADLTLEDVRQLGHAIAKSLPDSRGPLN